MTDDTTTIEITEAQRDELKARKVHERESYKAVMDRLLQATPADLEGIEGRDTHAAEVDTDAIADAVAARGVSLDAAEHRAIAEEVVGMLQG